LSLLDRKGLQFTFFNDKRVGEDYKLLFYERTPAGRGFDCDDFLDAKPDFEAFTVLFQTGLQHSKESRKELEKILQAEGASKEWFPE
jgi:hypothetical protein